MTDSKRTVIIAERTLSEFLTRRFGNNFISLSLRNPLLASICHCASIFNSALTNFHAPFFGKHSCFKFCNCFRTSFRPALFCDCPFRLWNTFVFRANLLACFSGYNSPGNTIATISAVAKNAR